MDGESAERALTFFYQLALSALSTSIVSGAMAERCNFKSFIIFAFFNVFTYSLPAHWIWYSVKLQGLLNYNVSYVRSPNGWLRQLGAKDNAGCGVVHLIGGWSSLVATLYLGPRTGIQGHIMIFFHVMIHCFCSEFTRDCCDGKSNILLCRTIHHLVGLPGHEQCQYTRC